MSKGKKYMVEQASLQQLVGEFKIALQRLQNDMKYTDEEHEEMIEYIKQWEEILY